VKPRAFEDLDATAAIILHPQLGHPYAAAMLQTRTSIHAVSQDIHQGLACAVLDMENPSMTMCRLEGGRE
jgi:hypothetical protein